jgi:hypothetical protein
MIMSEGVIMLNKHRSADVQCLEHADRRRRIERGHAAQTELCAAMDRLAAKYGIGITMAVLMTYIGRLLIEAGGTEIGTTSRRFLSRRIRTARLKWLLTRLHLIA